MTISAMNMQTIRWPCDGRPAPLKNGIEMDAITGDVASITRRKLLARDLEPPTLHRVAGHSVLVLVVPKGCRSATIDGRPMWNCASLCWRDTRRRLVAYSSGGRVGRALVAFDGMLIRIADRAHTVVDEQHYDMTIGHHDALLFQRYPSSNRWRRGYVMSFGARVK